MKSLVESIDPDYLKIIEDMNEKVAEGVWVGWIEHKWWMKEIAKKFEEEETKVDEEELKEKLYKVFVGLNYKHWGWIEE